MARSAAASGASSALGWLYFVSWSVSFYPQAVLNYRRKSVVGMSFDFQTLTVKFVVFVEIIVGEEHDRVTRHTTLV